MPYVARAKLHQREPSLAIRSKLVERCTSSIKQVNTRQDANLVSAYDHLRTDWLTYLYKPLHKIKLKTLDLQSNLCMQLSSCESKYYKDHLTQFISELVSHPTFDNHKSSSPPPLSISQLPSSLTSGLDVIWLTGDVANHPVCRFLLGFFGSPVTPRLHKHRIVSLQRPNDRFKSFFEKECGIEVIDVSHFTAEKTSQIELYKHMSRSI